MKRLCPHPPALRKPAPRRGLSLLELLAVLSILGILATIGVARLTPGVQGNLASGTESFRILMALRQARAAAIATGDDHLVRFVQVGPATSLQIERDTGGGAFQVVEGPYPLSPELSVAIAGGDPRYNFQGEAVVAPVITVVGPQRTQRITVVAATGWGLLEEL